MDKSPASHKSYHALPTPDHRAPSNPLLHQTDTNTTINQTSQTPTISRLDHVLPNENIEEILDTELGTDVTPVINALHNTLPLDTRQITTTTTMQNDHSIPPNLSIIHQILDTDNKTSIQSIKSTMLISHNPFTQPIINGNGTVAINNLTEFQQTILNTYPHTFFKQH